MNVLMLIPNFHPHLGGAELQAQQLSRGLQQRGHSVTVLTARRPGLHCCDSVDGVPIVRLFRPESPRLVRQAILAIQIALWLIRHRRGWDLIHAHMAYGETLVAVLVGKMLLGKPVLVKFAVSGTAGDLATKSRGVAGLIALSILRRASAFVVVDPALRDEMESAGLPADRAEAIPNFVDLRAFPTHGGDTDPLAGRVPVGPRVLAASRLHPDKSLHTLLDAWSSVRARHPTAQLLIAGDGPLRQDLETRADALGIRASTHFLGGRRDLPRVMSTCEVLVMTSRSEGMPNVLLEAAAAGAIRVSSDIPPARTLITDREDGRLFPAGDAAELSRCLIEVLSEPDVRHTYRKAARRRVEEQYELNRVIDRYPPLYERLLSGRELRQPDAVPGGTRTRRRASSPGTDED